MASSASCPTRPCELRLNGVVCMSCRPTNQSFFTFSFGSLKPRPRSGNPPGERKMTSASKLTSSISSIPSPSTSYASGLVWNAERANAYGQPGSSWPSTPPMASAYRTNVLAHTARPPAALDGTRSGVE